MAAHICSTLAIPYRDLSSSTHSIPLPTFTLHDSYPSLPHLRSTAKDCTLCTLLIKKIDHEATTYLRDIIASTPGGVQGLHNITVSLTDVQWITESYMDEYSARTDLDGRVVTARTEEENGVYLLQMMLEFENTKEEWKSRRMGKVWFSVHVDENDVSTRKSMIRRWRIRDRPDGPESVDMMNRWIEECVDAHPKCRLGKGEKKFLPTRVLDVGTIGSGGSRVVETPGKGIEEGFVALSYCWGPPPWFTTTTVTLRERMEEIKDEILPGNLRDAVLVTRLLGLRYLWIDSLCILQDSKADWAHESQFMNLVYKHAHVVIAAIASPCQSEGFIKPRSLGPDVAFELPVDTGKGEEKMKIYLRATDTDLTHFQSDVEATVWNDRAWTLQERYLARRIVYFSERKLYFECRTGYQVEDNVPVTWEVAPLRLNVPDSEDEDKDEDEKNEEEEDEESDNNEDGKNLGTPPNPAPAKANTAPPTELDWRDVWSSSESSSSEDLSSSSEDSDSDSPTSSRYPIRVPEVYNHWYNLLGEYTPRSITYGSDKLPAISGMVAELLLASLIPDERYLFGLWESDLPYGLLWIASSETDTPRPTAFRGPSWSWVSFDGQIVYSATRGIEGSENDCCRPARPVMELVDVDEHHGLTGLKEGVEDVKMVVRAPVMELKLQGPVREEWEWRGKEAEFRYYLVDEWEGEKVNVGRARLDVVEEVEMRERWVVCLPVTEQVEAGGESNVVWSGLVLENAKEKGKFIRIGVYFLEKEMVGFFEGVDMAEITIV